MRTRQPSRRFVAWIDIMGAGNLMHTSLRDLAAAVTVLNEQCALAADGQVELHPLNDGIFALADDRTEILHYLGRAFSNMATVLSTAPTETRRPVRGALAHGEVITLHF